MTALVKHKSTGKVHKLLEVYHDDEMTIGGDTKANLKRMAVTVQTNFISEPTATTDSWLGDWQSFQKEFEAVK